MNITVEQQNYLDSLGINTLLKMSSRDICYTIWESSICQTGFSCRQCPFYEDIDKKPISDYKANLNIVEALKALKL